jgi:hypothetical protein
MTFPPGSSRRVAAVTVHTHLWRFVAIVMIAGAVITPAQAATHKRHKKPPACPPGRYVVRGAALIPAAPSALYAVVVQDQDVGIDSDCPLSKGRVTPTTQGTQVFGRWASCGPLEGVRLRALTESLCNAMAGVLRARRYSARRFVATRSRCGDGIVDVGAGEQCDVLQGCDPPATCTHCRCKARPPSTSTTSTSTTTLAAP